MGKIYPGLTGHPPTMARQSPTTYRTESGRLPVVVCASGAPLRRFRAWLGRGPDYLRQGGGDLGQRMERSITRAFRQGVGRVLVIGADVPGLTPELLREAAAALDSADIVLGPATDGGYYLIGMRRSHPGLFQDIAWGSGEVLLQTRAALEKTGSTGCELPVISDIDRPEDLDFVCNDPRFADALAQHPRLSVIIPTLNEEGSIAATLASARTARNVEVIVADGGSTDRTRMVAQAAGAIVLEVSGGRAAQLNAGAAEASAKRLLFLHADTHLPPGYEAAIQGTLDDPAVALGAFRFRTDWDTPTMRFMMRVANLRSKFLGMPYGDQGLFVERRIFEQAGGFPLRYIMEDYEFVRQLRRLGRIVTIDSHITTSARRWQALGPWRVWLKNQLMIVCHTMGVSDKRLASIYRRSARQANKCESGK